MGDAILQGSQLNFVPIQWSKRISIWYCILKSWISEKSAWSPQIWKGWLVRALNFLMQHITIKELITDASTSVHKALGNYVLYGSFVIKLMTCCIHSYPVSINTSLVWCVAQIKEITESTDRGNFILFHCHVLLFCVFIFHQLSSMVVWRGCQKFKIGVLPLLITFGILAAHVVVMWRNWR